jgi:hypothetical protein
MKRPRTLWVVSIALAAFLLALGFGGCVDLLAADGDLDFHLAELPWAIAVGEHGVSVNPAIY